MVSFRKQFGGAPKVKHSCNKVPEILLPGLYPRQLKTHLFIAALFRIARKKQEQPSCLSAGEWINNYGASILTGNELLTCYKMDEP